MTRGDPSDEAARADGGHEESARLLIGPESDQEALRRLLRARSDPRRLAAELPRGEAPEGAEAGLVLLSLFCVGCLAAGLAMPFALAGPAVGVAVGVGGTALYLAVRPVVKRFGVLSAGSFTVDADGVIRAIAGVGRARRGARLGGEEPGRARDFGVAVVFLLLALGLPVAVAVAADLPEVMLGWMVMAMLALNEAPLLAARTRLDARRRSAEILDSEFGLAMATAYLSRGGDAERLAEGVRVDRLVPPGEHAFASVMREAFLKRSLARFTRGG